MIVNTKDASASQKPRKMSAERSCTATRSFDKTRGQRPGGPVASSHDRGLTAS